MTELAPEPETVRSRSRSPRRWHIAPTTPFSDIVKTVNTIHASVVRVERKLAWRGYDGSQAQSLMPDEGAAKAELYTRILASKNTMEALVQSLAKLNESLETASDLVNLSLIGGDDDGSDSSVVVSDVSESD